MKTAAFFIMPMVLSLLSCTDSFTGMVARTPDDPNVNGALRADSFSEINTVVLSWDWDEATDEYILQKAENNDGKNFSYSVVYSGSATVYSDKRITTGKLYRYRLDRRRGGRVFTGRIVALGAGASIDDGLNRDNSTVAKAEELTYKIGSCCYYYRFDDATVLSNEDHYKVKVPAFKKAVIAITENAANDFRFRIPGASQYKTLGATGSTFEVDNNTEFEKYCHFAISANPDNFVTGDTPGGDIRKYKIELSKILGQ